MANVRDPFERQHIANLAAYVRMIDEIFRQATQEAASIGAMVQNIGFDESDLFSFEKYPYTKARIDRLMSGLAGGVQTTIVNGINAEWTLANNKNNELARRVFGDNIGRLTQAQYRRYFSTNDAAREAFLARKEQGLNLSERVWIYANGFKSDMELGLDVGIRNGVPADEMSRELRQYLRHPDKLFRRVRDEHGDLVLSKRAQDFHPGQGVYRSSYMNARRLTATETNIAYRTADYERAQQLDFIVGIEVKLSNNHNCKGVPAGMFYDICDELQGRYPKDFKFTGWHSQCRCHVETILKTEEELMSENVAILRGDDPSSESIKKVSDVPEKFKEWFDINEERAKYAKSIPYFIVDNPKYVPKKFIESMGTLERKATPNIVTSAIQSLRKFVNPDYVTDNEVKILVEDFAKQNPSLFDGGLDSVHITKSSTRGFMWNERIYYKSGPRKQNSGNSIYINNISMQVGGGEEWNPLQELKGAISAIRKGDKLTFKQEYAIESLWHEIRHAGAVGYVDINKRSSRRTKAMECINQFCARRSYVGFLKSIGGKSNNRDSIILDGYGYRSTLKNFQNIIDHFKLDTKSVYVYFKDRIQTTPYENIFDEVAQYIARKGHIDIAIAEQIVTYMGMMSENDFTKYLKGVM